MSAFYGYPGLVWGAAYESMSWLYGQLSAAPTAAAATSAATTVFDTLRNACEAIDVYQLTQSTTSAYQDLSSIAALPLNLDPLTQQFFASRYAAITLLQTSVAALLPAVNILTVSNKLAAGTPSIPYPGLLEFYMTYLGEATPAALSVANFTFNSAENALIWSNVATAVSGAQTTGLTQAYDAATKMYSAGALAYKRLQDFTSGPLSFTGAYSLAQTWNLMVALPTTLNFLNVYTSSPQSAMNQQCGTIRYILNQFMFRLANFLLGLRRNQTSQTALTPVNQNDTLMDIAARSTGNFENWTQMAQINNLQPPWVNTISTPQGSALLIPNGQQTTSTQPVDYAANVLGTDFDFGPIIGNMPAWRGDYSFITGLANFNRALGRRLQTSLGSLIYHSDYGSRIPPEVGAIQYSDTIGHIAAYGQSAILSDPRTAAVISATAQAGPNFSVMFQALVQPIGPASTPVSLNETLGTVQ